MTDHGFRFARGGRVEFYDDAVYAIDQARREAEVELAMWRKQPSHALGDRGELVPLGDVAGSLAP